MVLVTNARLIFNSTPDGELDPNPPLPRLSQYSRSVGHLKPGDLVHDTSNKIDPDTVPLNGGILLTLVVLSPDPFMRTLMKGPTTVKSYLVRVFLDLPIDDSDFAMPNFNSTPTSHLSPSASRMYPSLSFGEQLDLRVDHQDQWLCGRGRRTLRDPNYQAWDPRPYFPPSVTSYSPLSLQTRPTNLLYHYIGDQQRTRTTSSSPTLTCSSPCRTKSASRGRRMSTV
jgi:hypothetical protein